MFWNIWIAAVGRSIEQQGWSCNLDLQLVRDLWR